MPGMSGHDLQLHLAANGYRIPIIFITAFPEKMISPAYRKAGSNSAPGEAIRGSDAGRFNTQGSGRRTQRRPVNRSVADQPGFKNQRDLGPRRWQACKSEEAGVKF